MYKYTVQSFPQYRATVSVVDSAHGNDKEKYLTNITVEMKRVEIKERI